MENLPHSLHFVGIGGIGMSAIAQMAAALGFEVTGSDRAADSYENRRIFSALRAQGIRIYPQDGSRFGEQPLPGALVYSTAIEEDNPDFKASSGIPRIHRSAAMGGLVEKTGASVFAVTGTCGKTSVSAWLAEALDRTGYSPSLISGGLAKHFAKGMFAGNYARGGGRLCVVEADESDKSLLNYSADHALILNIGTDHYSKDELAEVFRKFLKKTRVSAVIQKEAFDVIGPAAVSHLKNVTLFSSDPKASAPEGFKLVRVTGYCAGYDGISANIDGRVAALPAPGLHNAENAAAVYSALSAIGISPETAAAAVSAFSGVWRRFDFAGKTAAGADVYDDYAHNVEKICSCVKAAKSICRGKCLFLFQPHGFSPLRFMREALFPELEKILGGNDVFAFLPVYYAGGTAAFSPTSAEVAGEYASRGKEGRYICFGDRAAAERAVSALTADDIAVVMGARDNSLSDWAAGLSASFEK